jgi:6-phosphogluconolactonase
MLLTGYAGTYAGKDNKSLWRLAVDTETGALSQAEPVLTAADSKYVAVQAAPNLLAVPRKINGKAGLAVVNLDADPLQVVGEYAEEQDCSAYVTGDGEFWYTANYHDGEIRIYKLAPSAKNFPGNNLTAAAILAGREKIAPGIAKDSGSAASNLQLIHKIATGKESGCHQIIVAGQFLLAVCLLRDQLLIYDRSKKWQQVGVVNFPRGTGPRHGIFDSAGENLFLVSELSNELFIFAAGKNDFLTLISTQPLVAPNNLPAAAAAIRLSPDEKFLYVSVRERNVICVFALQGGVATKIQEVSCGGDHPRDLVLTPDGKFVLAVNRYPGSIVSFKRDAHSGKIGAQCGRIAIPQAVSVAWAAPPKS